MKQKLRQEPFPGCFMLFAGANYYPAGGYEDLVGFGNKKELEHWFLDNQGHFDWSHVVRHSTMQIVSAFQSKSVLNKADGTIASFDRRFVDQ